MSVVLSGRYNFIRNLVTCFDINDIVEETGNEETKEGIRKEFP